MLSRTHSSIEVVLLCDRLQHEPEHKKPWKYFYFLNCIEMIHPVVCPFKLLQIMQKLMLPAN